VVSVVGPGAPAEQEQENGVGVGFGADLALRQEGDNEGGLELEVNAMGVAGPDRTAAQGVPAGGLGPETHVEGDTGSRGRRSNALG
jgi:hypothetical protein